ncbi:hypothetical protein EO98_04595 [Methanosarcina sp. 2.H.T.1A.6]|uniref:glycosyltransferase family 2 protein n=1 Tax=unclassified Methanosarcina TaxID=2644672 RepID=UPI0006216BD7|nr:MULTISPECIES: glycosyltransferase family A protein [unclassified Methanosarcina]KKG11618.1 hypothetical protein EO97_16265 [Methanosarcina sp. 2.H.T.1A.15]KKG15987.1 hypothetical protein EO94_05045 [Methanosarcina sp. 2.H.T.1A.3]KKG21009.1 hypothetical protein EO96_06970 [Methanosarcina sp. 2.H.T.1A.8]KKG21266.1 hypothetical protein EO98_04595 [Methanosarcina sp. 2.H.T.1A.6]
MIPKVSVVIPLYNKEAYIKRALESVLSQTIQDFEIVVVDDGSTDKSVEIVKEFKDSRIHLIQQINSGVSAARNRGAKEGRSGFIAFLDADDEWAPNFLEMMLNLIKKFPSAGLYAMSYVNEYGNNDILNQDTELNRLIPKEGLVTNYFKIAKKGYYIFCSSSVVVPKQVFLELGGFRVGFWWGEDVDLWGRIALKYPIAYNREIGAIYHQDIANSAGKRKEPAESHPFVDSARKFLISGDFPADILDDLEEYIEYQEVFTARHNIRCGDKGLALKILFRKDTKLVNRKKLIRSIVSSSIKDLKIQLVD